MQDVSQRPRDRTNNVHRSWRITLHAGLGLLGQQLHCFLASSVGSKVVAHRRTLGGITIHPSSWRHLDHPLSLGPPSRACSQSTSPPEQGWELLRRLLELRRHMIFGCR